MVIVQIITKYSYEAVDDITAKYIEVVKNNPFDRSLGKRILTSASRPTSDGVEVIALYSAKPGKLTELIKTIAKNMTNYYDVKGFSYKLQYYATEGESFEIAGMTAPDHK